MSKYLFFRTDRIGDFLLSAILLNSIKRNDPNSHITVVCSSKNYNYVKNSHLVDEAILYPEKSFYKKIIFLLRMYRKKNYCTIVCDGKRRSIYSSILIKSKIKILFSTKSSYKILFKYFFTLILLDKYAKSKILEIHDVVRFLKFNYTESDLNTINIKNNRNLHHSENLSLVDKIDFVLLHFDEKWLYNSYIKSYKKIEPKIDELKQFISNIVFYTKKNLIITTGIINNHLLDKLKIEFHSIGNKVYKKTFDSNFVIFFSETNFFNIEYLVSKSHLLIASHGAITHAAASLNVPIFDIIDDSESIFFDKWSSHFRNYRKFLRKDFNILSKEILNHL